MVATNAEQLARLTVAEADAELQYIAALKQSDGSKTRLAWQAWKNAADAVTEFVMRHPQLHQGDE